MAAQKEITDYAEIQQMEIDALKSIFMEDFEEEETKTAAWNVSVSCPSFAASPPCFTACTKTPMASKA